MKILILTIGVFVLWNYPEARIGTANFLRFTADLLSPIERPLEQRRKQ